MTSIANANDSGRRRRGRAATTVARLTALSATVVLLASPIEAAEHMVGGVTAPVGTYEPSFSLGLQAVLPEAGIEAPSLPIVATSTTDELPRDAGRLRRPHFRASAEGARLQPQLELGDGMRPHAGFGHWIKRHWWVPALIAAAAGVAIAESGGDDDRGGEDD
jgi:hypothetical protein